MKLNADRLRERTTNLDLTGFVRIIPRQHEATPLGMGFGKTRFASPKDAFKLVYVAEGSCIALAETLVRDRFQGRTTRKISEDEFDAWSICEINTRESLTVLDLHDPACNLLNVPTDVVHARNQKAGRRFSQDLYEQTALDGILYPSRMQGRPCVAVYDRAVAKLALQGRAIGLPLLASLASDLKELRVTLIK